MTTPDSERVIDIKDEEPASIAGRYEERLIDKYRDTYPDAEISDSVLRDSVQEAIAAVLRDWELLADTKAEVALSDALVRIANVNWFIERIRNGDFIEMLKELGSYIRGCLSQNHFPMHMAKDLTQEVLTNCWKGIANFDPNLPLLPWMIGIARNLIDQERVRRGKKWGAGSAEIPAGEMGHFVDPKTSQREEGIFTDAVNPQNLSNLRQLMANILDARENFTVWKWMEYEDNPHIPEGAATRILNDWNATGGKPFTNEAHVRQVKHRAFEKLRKGLGGNGDFPFPQAS